MTDTTKSTAEHSIQVGGSPKELLRARGDEGAEERDALLPQVPDFLGYVLGLMLVWLLYTGYNSVVALFTSPDSAVVKFGSRAKQITQETAKVISEGEQTKQVLSTIKDASSAQSLEAAVDVLGGGLARGRLKEDGEIPAPEPEAEPAGPRKGWTARQLDSLNNRINHWTKAAGGSLKGIFSGSSGDGRAVEASTPAEEGADEAEEPRQKESYEWF